MRIVSLLPSATEIVFALGLEDDLVARTDECDFPAAVADIPVVSRQAIPYDSGLSAEEIDARVSELVAAGEPLYTLDADRIREVAPGLILAQDLCRVCAVPSGHVEEALATIGCDAEVLSLDPMTLDDVLDSVLAVGGLTGALSRAGALVQDLRRRLDATRAAVAGRPMPRTLTLEWRDPPYGGGHWVPDMVAAAGGTPVLSARAEVSRRVTWDEIAEADPEVVVFMPCGYGLERAKQEAEGLAEVPALRGRDTFVVDATSYFSRPSPRVVEGVEALAWALHPDVVPSPPEGRIERIV